MAAIAWQCILPWCMPPAKPPAFGYAPAARPCRDRCTGVLSVLHLTLLPARLLLCCAVQVFDGPPATVAELAAVEEDLTAGAMQADVVATNQLPLDLQLLQASQPLGPELLSSLFCCAFWSFYFGGGWGSLGMDMGSVGLMTAFGW